MSKTVKQSFLKKISGKRQILIFAAILAVALVHFVVQMSFIQSENLRSAESAMRIETVKSEEVAAETKPSESRLIGLEAADFAPRKVKIAAPAERAQPVASRRPEIVAPPVKRKIVRETREARLRRAEKILTGV
jgi:hypothetical protein